MATLTIEEAPVSGLEQVTFSAADALGDEAATGLGIALLVRNNDTVTRTVTVDTPGTVRGLAIENPAIAVPAGAIAVAPLIRQVFGSTAVITYDDATSLEVALIRLAR